MVKTIKMMILPAILIILAACEITGGTSYNNDYAAVWYKVSTADEITWDALKLDMSDQDFQISTTTFQDDLGADDYAPLRKGTVSKNGSYLTLTISEQYYNETWYSKEEYIELQQTLGQDATTAQSLADAVFTSNTVSYFVNPDPHYLSLGSGDALSGTYHDTVMASLTAWVRDN